jgi:hypothetical protein
MPNIREDLIKKIERKNNIFIQIQIERNVSEKRGRTPASRCRIYYRSAISASYYQ